MKSEKGFTIVELLIVIVVIGILAAIVIVAYNGVTQRANTTKASANATSVKKVAEAMNADSAYPTGLANLQAGSTSTKLPSGVLINRPTIGGTGTLTDATTAAGTSIPAASAANAFNTVVIFSTTGGAVILYRDGAGAIQPIYYGSGSSTSTFTQFPA